MYDNRYDIQFFQNIDIGLSLYKQIATNLIEEFGFEVKSDNPTHGGYWYYPINYEKYKEFLRKHQICTEIHSLNKSEKFNIKQFALYIFDDFNYLRLQILAC